jgi:hypothetical protein
MIEATLDDWDMDLRDQQVPAEPDAVEFTIRQVADRWSADLFLRVDPDETGESRRWLAITASNGLFSAIAQLDDGVWRQLSTNPERLGSVDFAHGGQTGTWPRRFCVGVDEAVAAARHYVETGDLLDPSRWLAEED